MMTADLPRKKRRWMPWWRLAAPLTAFCPNCHVPCITESSQENGDEGGVTQYRCCPVCGRKVKTRYRE